MSSPVPNAARKRDLRLDLIRALAAVMVLAVHFFMNSDINSLPVQGLRMQAATVVRTGLISCVPLFLLLSGWLLRDRRWSRQYYRGLLRVLLAYVLAGVVCLIVRTAVRGEGFVPFFWVKELVGFSAAPYGWYVGMYLGLFLLIPFLNAMWAALGDKEQRALAVTLLLLSALPTVNDVTLRFDVKLLPDCWTQLYPITYYVLGMYLRKRPLAWSRRACFAGAAGAALCGGLVHIWLAQGGPLSCSDITYWGGIFPTASSVLLFSALRQCRVEAWPLGVQRVVSRIARLSLSIYLISWIPDYFLYAALAQRVPAALDRLIWFPVMVLAVLVLSLPMAQILVWGEEWILRWINRRFPGKHIT